MPTRSTELSDHQLRQRADADKQDADIYKRWLNGELQKDIADSFGVTPARIKQRITRYCRRYGVLRKKLRSMPEGWRGDTCTGCGYIKPVRHMPDGTGLYCADCREDVGNTSDTDVG